MIALIALADFSLDNIWYFPYSAPNMVLELPWWGIFLPVPTHQNKNNNVHFCKPNFLIESGVSRVFITWIY